MSRWQDEFGLGWAVPVCIAEALEDVSWHNDTMPSFIVAGYWERQEQGAPDLRVWVNHPEPAEREDPDAPRFLVYRDDVEAPIFTSSDESDAGRAVEALRAAVAAIVAEW